jgi:hypothetical protein
MEPAVEKPRAHRGRPLTAEHKANLSAAMRRSHANRPAAPTASVLPAVLLRLELIAARHAGAPFAEVWDDAVASAVAGMGLARRGWLEVLEDTREAWRRAYERDGTQACWSALESARI